MRSLNAIALAAMLTIACTFTTSPPTNEEIDIMLAKTGGWSQSGSMQAGVATRQVSLQVQFPIARDYTVQIGVDGLLALATPAFTPSAEALITWKVEGNAITRRVTVANGVSVTGVGQAVSVLVKDTSFGVTPADASYQATIQVAPGSRPSQQKPPSLRSDAFILPPGSQSVPIPQDAGVISAYVAVIGPVATPIVDGNALVAQANAAGVLFQYQLTAGNSDWVPIAPGADRLILINQSAVVYTYSVIFGIDG